MRKFKLLKDLPYTKAGVIYTISDNNLLGIYDYKSEELKNGCIDYLNKEDVENNPEWFEEIIEKETPKFKIGNAIVFYNDDNKIYSVVVGYDDFYKKYKISTDSRWYNESELKLATEEEFNKYYKTN